MAEFHITVSDNGEFDINTKDMGTSSVSVMFSGIVDWILAITPNTKPDEVKKLLKALIDVAEGDKPRKFRFETIRDKLLPSSSNGPGSGFLNRRSGFDPL